MGYAQCRRLRATRMGRFVRSLSSGLFSGSSLSDSRIARAAGRRRRAGHTSDGMDGTALQLIPASAITIAKTGMHVDFTGSSPQQSLSLSLPRVSKSS